jgi:hypothetical protein
MSSPWRRSPQELDPLSWFAGPGLPVVLAVAAVLQGVVITILYWGMWSDVALQFVAMPFFLLAGWVTARWVQPNRPQFGWRQAYVVLLIATLGVVLSAIGTVVVAGVASVVFSYTIAARTMAFLDTSAADEEVYSAVETRTEEQETGGTARVSARVAPFIEGIAAAGVITPTDRALAAQIARSLRAELVTASNRSWLDVVASETGMVVSDPGRLADRMNESQRAALRGLLVAATENSVVDTYTLLIELRAQPDGSTAVALSIDLDLPEGRRFVLIAPYYLTLKTTVDDLSWDDGRSMMLKFRIPPN